MVIKLAGCWYRIEWTVKGLVYVRIPPPPFSERYGL
jgi:hypothetical protein